MIIMVPVRTSLTFAAAFVACAASLDARAQDASPWVSDTHSAMRLIAGSRSGNVLLGGIGFQLQPGWKTYWRSPGDSGVPPRLDFAKSENVDSVTVLWPAPAKFADGSGGISLGYQKQVVIPLRIHAKDADKPVILRAEINYAVCEKLCVPVEAKAELAFTSSASAEDNAIAAALDTVPKPAKVGDANPLTIRSVRREGKIGVLVDVATPDGKDVDLFAEGPTLDWALPVPKIVKREPGGILRFGFDLDGLPPGASPDNAALKLTLVSPNASYEFNVNLK